MIYMDPTRHTELRALVSRAFTPRRVAEIEPLTRRVARDLIEGLVGREECDVQHDYATILPSVVIAQMIGIPDETIDEVRGWTESFLEIQGPDDYMDSLGKCYELFAQLLAARRERPEDDLMSALLAAEVDGTRLSDEELLGFCFLLVLAGNDTTSGLIGSGIVLMDRHRDQRALVLDDPTLWPDAVEEINRLESPTQVLPRCTTRDVTFHDIVISAGSRTMLIWGSANHDDRVYPDPEQFDVTRDGLKHLVFGHGVHYCLGANLARLEARVAFEEWYARFPDCELAGAPRWITSIWARAYGEVPIRLNA